MNPPCKFRRTTKRVEASRVVIVHTCSMGVMSSYIPSHCSDCPMREARDMPEYDKPTARDIYTHMEIACKELEIVKLLLQETDYNYEGFRKMMTQICNYRTHYKGVYADHLILDMEEDE